jgi:formamidopyrimidine-DNA glycosylase
MPEGPEVKRLALSLAKEISNKNLLKIEILSGRYIKKPICNLNEFNLALPQKIIGAGCHGKFIYILLENGYSLWSTLGMTGGWSTRELKHTRIKLEFNHKNLYFYDTRSFGTLVLCQNPEKLKKKLKSLGPDIMEKNFSPDKFLNALRTKNHWNITKALMDQKVIAGIGNYVKAEALWLAKINPWQNVSDLSDEKLLELIKAANQICITSFEMNGATIKNYKTFEGDTGNYSNRFYCYGRKFDYENNLIVKETTPDGRTTHWVPTRQLK